MSRLPQDLYGVREAPAGTSSKLRGAFTRNKTLLGVIGAVAVVGLALVTRKKTAAASGAASPAGSAAGTSTITAGSAYQPYDSSSADLYNAIQPQIEALQRLAQTTPTPTAPPSVPDGYYQAAGDAAIWKLSNGKLDFLTQPEAVALGYPNPTVVSKDDPMWTLPVADPGKTVPWAHG